MDTRNKNARIAGLLYMLVAITGPFVLIYVPGRLFVPGDAAATVGNIVANETLFRWHIAVGIVSELLFIATVLMLYRLLRDTGRELAAAMVILILLDAPLAFLSSANQVATLAFARGADILAVFDKPQRDALAALLIEIDRHGTLVSEVFWGLWLLPLGILVYRSGFIPRLIGVWLLVNGIAYVAISFTGILLPQYLDAVNTITFPVLFGEVALALWLLIAGARPRRPATMTAAA